MLAHNKAADAAFFSASHSSEAEGQTKSISGFFSRLRDRFAAARAARATYDELSQLSDRELADIGLHRGELYSMFLAHPYQGR